MHAAPWNDTAESSRRPSAAAAAQGSSSSSTSISGLVGQAASMDLNNHNSSGSRPSFDVGSDSRRPSAASTNSMSPRLSNHNNRPPLSPASVSSSSTNPWQTPRETLETGFWSHSPQSGAVPLPSPQPSTSSSASPKYHNLPRIATPSDDMPTPTAASPIDAEGSRGPPVSSPLARPGHSFQQPTRSSSTPEPRPPPVVGQMPTRSPTDPRPTPGGQQQSFTSQGLRPDHAKGPIAQMPTPRLTSGSTASVHDSAAKRSETPTSISSSQGASTAMVQGQQGQTARAPRRSGSVTYCAKCGLAVRGQFVRALHQVYHLDCFRCRDCDKVVAQKFFPVEDSDGGQYPLCERDYFARLDLICAKCNQALRSSYITACGDKFHVEHFSCSVCDTVFGANDSYYEHDKKVYCHYHYSISFANKCVGCETAILKQFVEINRNGRDECWHPECYMIHKFWNVRLASRNFTTPAANTPAGSATSLLDVAAGGLRPMSTTDTASARSSPGWSTEYTAEELKERQISMELKVSQIWLVLSGFEESSAACIGEMLRVVQERKLLDVILLAEKFILHVETLFAVIDDLEAQFALAGAKGMSHAREAKQLCRKLVNFFSMLSQISPSSNGVIPNMQELLTQVTQLAHYLKILIRIALTGAIKLDREQANPKAMTNALARLHLLSLDNSDTAVGKRGDHPDPKGPLDPWTGNETPEEMAKRSFDSLTRHPEGFIPSTQQVAYGYRSLAVESTGETTLRGPQDDDFVPNDGCAKCNGSIEDDCVRQGMFNRWHSGCIECENCGDKASNTKDAELSPMMRPSMDDDTFSHESVQQNDGSVSRHQRRTPPRVNDFLYEPPQIKYSPAQVVWCNLHRSPTSVAGFASVSRLEQFAFLLHVALRRLYLHFREHHHIPSALTRTEAETSDVKRVKSVTLDRKLSHTARVPQRSTVVESPAGKMADANGQVVTAREQVAAPVILPPVDTDKGETAQVDVIRPPFARNNTSVRIVSETAEQPESLIPEPDTLSPQTQSRRAPEDDALTLSDIPMIVKNTRKSPMDSLPLMALLSNLQHLIVRHFALLQLQKTSLGNVIDMDEVLELLDARKNQWWNKLFKGNAKKDQKKKGIFGVPIELLVERTGSDSQQGASNAVLRIPEFIEEITSTMRQQDMAVEGIFRKNGNIRRLQQLSDSLDKDYGAVTLSEENPVQLAALLKRFLREMPDPLLTFRLHKLFCAAATLPDAAERKRCLHLLMVLLPKPNRDSVEVLFIFLRWVASFSYRDEETGSRMDMQNLATVICPSILYARGANAAKDESFIAIQAVQQLLDGQDDFYRVPAELVFVLQENVHKIFEKEVDLPPKEISKHCAKYLQARGHTQMLQHQRPSHSGPSGGGPAPALRDQRERERDRPREREREPERPSESRLSNYGLNPPDTSALRASPASGSRPTSWGTGIPGTATGSSTPTSAPTSGSDRVPPGTLTMPTPQINGGPTSPSYLPSPGWRAPFHGPASNGSRQSSRGSAPSSPGIQEERRSFQMERERSRERAWTPTQPPPQ